MRIKAIMTTIGSANDLNFHLIIPLNAASKIMGIDWKFHDQDVSGKDNGLERNIRVTPGQ